MKSNSISAAEYDLDEMTGDILRTDRSKNFLQEALKMGFGSWCNTAEVFAGKSTELNCCSQKEI